MSILCITIAISTLDIAFLIGFGLWIDPSSGIAGTRVAELSRPELGENIMG